MIPTITFSADDPTALQVIAHARRLAQIVGRDSTKLDKAFAEFKEYRKVSRVDELTAETYKAKEAR